MDLSKFEALEGRISAMLDKMSTMSQKNEELENSLLATKRELEAAESLINELQAERDAILDRVDTILGRLE
ncbi:hypothetical protein C4J81_05485 [Deltaproteobacteria bacterium Smac51]|nr:hypothetical protein C4J81_05485 [Deltaproteobacteria bacterium Smac51]